MRAARVKARGRVVALAAIAIVAVAAAAAAGVAGAAGKTKVLHWGIATTPRTLFGPTDFSTEGASVMSLVNEGMLAFGPNDNLKPTLASSWKAVNPTTYVYTIRRGVKFSDGHPLRAADVAFSIGLHKDPKVASEESTFFTNVRAVHASGNKVTIVLSKPDSIWKYMPAHEAGYVYESSDVRSHLESYGTPSHPPIGTGPYMIKDFVVNSHVTLVRNPYYWGTKPYYDQIVFDIIPDPQTLLLAMRSGQIDGTFDVPGAQLNDWQSSPNVALTSYPSDGFHGLTLDMSDPPFDDVHVRRAIAYAIDRKGIINAVFGGAADPASTLDAPGFFSGVLPDSEVKQAYAAIPSYSYDPKKAQAELAQSSQPKGFTTTMNVPQDSATSTAISQAIQQNLKAIGINLNLNLMPGGPRFDVILQHGPHLGMQIIGNVADVPDPIELPWLYFKSDQASKGGNNSSNYRNATADRLITEAQSTTNGQLAARDALKVSKMGADAAAVVPIEWFTWHVATKKALKPSGLGAFYYNTVWVKNLATPR